ncbi:MAG TPA: hypothetical protein VMW48_06495 [Vicinamibacterales bacterium]|nr:hypothetical protein [Armatimonadota bacterium]HUU33694.1 hypothetical protein [Vicinamibacterales bacterium]
MQLYKPVDPDGPPGYAVAAGVVHRALPEAGRTRCGRDLRDTVAYCAGPITCPDCITLAEQKEIANAA